MKEMDESVDVELRPRFPLFGGWKTRYFLGYNVPSYEYLFNKGKIYFISDLDFYSFFAFHFLNLAYPDMPKLLNHSSEIFVKT